MPRAKERVAQDERARRIRLFKESYGALQCPESNLVTPAITHTHATVVRCRAGSEGAS